MRKFLLSFILFLTVSIVWSQTNTVKHTVADGESLYSISKKYNTSVATLIDLNPQVDEGIKTGMVLNVPQAAESPKTEIKEVEKPKTETIVEKTETEKTQETSNSINATTQEYEYHTVAEGETYYSISKKYKTTVSALMELNNNATVRIGEKLIIAKKSSSNVVTTETPKQDAPKSETPKNEVTTTEKAPAVVFEEVKTEQEKPKTETPKSIETPKQEQVAVVEVEKYTDKTVVKTVDDNKIPKVEPKAYNNAIKKILIVPFDPYLYWSDADMEIAKQSKLEHTKVRQAFRRRLNALLEPAGYETIHLLGGRIKDSLTDLNKIYKNVKYAYQDAVYNPDAQVPHVAPVNGQIKDAEKNTTVERGGDATGNSRASLAKDEGKYYGVKQFDPNFFPYFNNKYEIDYYIFVNQFEVKTNYSTCLDRATQNYERSLITHFSIYDNTGKRLAGNRIKINYHSNQNNIQRILTDNMQNIANQIIGELPKAK